VSGNVEADSLLAAALLIYSRVLWSTLCPLVSRHSGRGVCYIRPQSDSRLFISRTHVPRRTRRQSRSWNKYNTPFTRWSWLDELARPVRRTSSMFARCLLDRV